MSFRARLTTFFALIVVLPMLAFGFLVFRLIADSETGKVDARAAGVASVAANIYRRQTALGAGAARLIASEVSLLTGSRGEQRLQALVAKAGLARVRVTTGTQVLADAGEVTALAPGVARVHPRPGAGLVTVEVSTLTAPELTRDIAGLGVEVLVRARGATLGGSVRVPAARTLPPHGNVNVNGARFRAITQTFAGFGDQPVQMTILVSAAKAGSSVNASRVVAGAFLLGFLLLAILFSLQASRALQSQVRRFLQAARKLGGGDFSSRVEVEGRDEFAALGQEFNRMSDQLAGRLEELTRERARLRELIQRIGQTFGSNLDRSALMELALRTALDAVQAQRGRLSVRGDVGDGFGEVTRVGSFAGCEEQVRKAEDQALVNRQLAEAAAGELHVAAVALGATDGSAPYGVITVGREGSEFGDGDRELLRYLATQATLALENIELHFQVQRQAITDELTGLANHGHFQELLGHEIEQVRRYGQQLGLVMLDIDNFKTINDTYGHQQGDVVLREVARALRETSRDADTPARYGGEELAVILPHTDLDGCYVIAERVRKAIEALRIPRLDGPESLRITASVGAASSSSADKDELIASADAALYQAKRGGKNRTVKAVPETANLLDGE